jgi:tripartite-type tricarboxylate transporter receptor subunit TctC
MRIVSGLVALAMGAAAALVPPTAAAADPVEEFYKGKTLRIVIGYAAGGGYDLYGRVFAEHFGRFVPGRPTIVPQNMPGAGSFVAAKFIHDVAPKDGTVFGCVSQTLPLDAAMSTKQDIDVTVMPYVGRLVDNVDIGLGAPGAWFKTYDEIRTREIVVGATGGASAGYLVPAALKEHGGAIFKIVSGYGGSNDVLLAMERKEVDLVGAIGLPGILQRNAPWITEGRAPVLYQTALKRHPLLPNVVTIAEVGTSERGTGVLRALAASADIGRSIVTTPGVPPERLAALRKAFEAMIKDPEFVATMKKRDITLAPAPGAEIDTLVRDLSRTPRPVLDELQKLMASAKK